MKAARLAFALLVVALVSCNRSTRYHHYQPTDTDGWQRAHALTFTLPEAQATGTYALSIGMRYTPAYPYQGLWVVSVIQLSHPSAVLTDTIYFPTSSDSAYALPLGSGITLLQREQPLRRLTLKRGQQATVTLSHNMTRELLPFIRDVGVRLQQE